MTDRLLLENQIAIMSALVEIAHAVGYGTKMSTAETIASLRQRVQESERQRDAPELLNLPDDWSVEQVRDFYARFSQIGGQLRKASTRYASIGELRQRLCTRVRTMTDQELVDLSSMVIRE